MPVALPRLGLRSSAVRKRFVTIEEARAAARNAAPAKFDEAKHPRAADGRFIRVGQFVSAIDDFGEAVQGTVTGVDPTGNVTLRTPDGYARRALPENITHEHGQEASDLYDTLADPSSDPSTRHIVEAAITALQEAGVSTSALAKKRIKFTTRVHSGSRGTYFANDKPPEIGVDPKSPHPTLTMIHELGHHFDWAVARGRGASSESAGASKTNPFAANLWFLHMYNSKKVKLIEQELNEGRSLLTQTNSYEANAQMRLQGKLPPRYAEYLMRPREAWARAFTQWVASRTTSGRAADEWASPPKFHWDEDDFAQNLDEPVRKILRSAGVVQPTEQETSNFWDAVAQPGSLDDYLGAIKSTLPRLPLIVQLEERGVTDDEIMLIITDVLGVDAWTAADVLRSDRGLDPDVEGADGTWPSEDEVVKSGKFNEAEHPRDAHGRFIRVGDALTLPDGRRGTVVSLNDGGKVRLRTTRGETIRVDPTDLSASGSRQTTLTGLEPATRQQRRALSIPPAWTDVLIHPDVSPDNPNPAGVKILAVGRDGKGREQRVYSSAHAEAQAAKKFERVRQLSEQAGKLDAALTSNQDDDSFAALTLIRRLGLRPGSTTDTGADKQAYGASTLEARHARVDGATATLTFTGKKGVPIELHTDDPQVVSLLKQRLAGKSGSDRLFPAATDSSLRDKLQSVLPGFKPKDLRTLVGTGEALRVVRDAPPPQPPNPGDERAVRRAKLEVAKQVSALLGNTPSVALESYIDPTVFGSWEAPLASATKSETDRVQEWNQLVLDHAAGTSFFPPLPPGLPEDDEPEPDDVTKVLGRFDEKLHPRGKDGRFIHIGGAVSLPTGGVARVVTIRDDGSVVTTRGDFKPKDLKTATPRPPAYTREAGARHAAALAPARRRWLQRLAADRLQHAQEGDPELEYWRGVLDAASDAPSGAKPPPPAPAVQVSLKPIAEISSAAELQAELRKALDAGADLSALDPHQRDTIEGQEARPVLQQPTSADDVTFTDGGGVMYDGRQYGVLTLESSGVTGVKWKFMRSEDGYSVTVALPVDTGYDAGKRAAVAAAIDHPPISANVSDLKIDDDGLGNYRVLQDGQQVGEFGLDTSGNLTLDIRGEHYEVPHGGNIANAPAMYHDLLQMYARAHTAVESQSGALPPGHKVGFAQELLYDMARGSHRVPKPKVVTNQEMREAMEAAGELPTLEEFSKGKTLKITSRTGYGVAEGTSEFFPDVTYKKRSPSYFAKVYGTVELPSDLAAQQIGYAEYLMRTNGGHGTVDKEIIKAWKAKHPKGTLAQFVKSRDVKDRIDSLNVGSGAANKARASLRSKYETRIDALIQRKRKQQGTVNVPFHNIPHWSEVTMVGQSWSDVDTHLVVAAEGSYVPTLHTSGVVEDGVLYHRRAGEKRGGTKLDVGTVVHHDAVGAYRLTKYDDTTKKYTLERVNPTPGVAPSEWPTVNAYPIDQTLEDIRSKYTYVYEGGATDWHQENMEPGRSARPAVTTAKVNSDADDVVIRAMREHGGIVADNSKDINPGYRGRGAIYTGKMLVIGAEVKVPDDALENAKNEAFAWVEQMEARYSAQQGGRSIRRNGFNVEEAESAEDIIAEMKKLRVVNANSEPGPDVGLPVVSNGEEEMIRKHFQPKVIGSKRIEYVPHDQGFFVVPPSSEEILAAGREAAYARLTTSFGDNWMNEPTWVQGKEAVDAAITHAELMDAISAMTFPSNEVQAPGIRETMRRYANNKMADVGQENSKYRANQQGAPTSQRGRLTVEGYTPEEATKILRDLGIVGELEPQVPFTSVMRSNRREGLVLPLHRDYVSGEADLPKIRHLLTHGISGSSQGGIEAMMESIIMGGGLHSIAERFRRGIRVNSASPSGDIRSGIDHAVFVAHDSGSTVGSGSQVKFGLKPEAFLRRTITLATRDYGGMDTRYNHYKEYLNSLQRRAKEPETSLYASPSPRVRQYHITAKSKNPGSAEYNIGGSIPIEDIAVIGVNSEAMRTVINNLLDKAVAEGKITERPKVVLNFAAGSEETFASAIAVA